LADDNDAVHQGLRALLGREPDLFVVGDAWCGREAVLVAKALQPDVLIIDVSMPCLNGIEATQRILQVAPMTRVLVISAHSDSVYADRCMAIGASGYVLKQLSLDDLAPAIRTIRMGKTFVSASIPWGEHSRLRGRPRAWAAPSTPASLTSREADVLQKIVEHRCDKTIARELGLSIRTTERHRLSLMAKLGIHDSAGLTRYRTAAAIEPPRN
jgi:DNA-binding NarL/FixJ family response regulator